MANGECKKCGKYVPLQDGKCIDCNHKDKEEYNNMSDEAQDLYNMIKTKDPSLDHEDIMDNIYGYKNMEIFPTCGVCGKECIRDLDCDGNWLCLDKECSVHDEE